MPTALVVIALIYGLCLFGTALVNMGDGAIFFIGFCILCFVLCKISDIIRKKKEDEKWDDGDSIQNWIRLWEFSSVVE